MNKRKLRRVAIVALVLVLLCNTLGVQASTKKDDPTVIVKDYGSLYTAIAEAKDNDVIGIQGTITIPAIVDLNMSENKAVILRRMEAGAKLVVSGDYGADNKVSFRMISFDGNSTEVGGTEPFVEINGNAYFSMCDFKECFNQSDNGGAIEGQIEEKKKLLVPVEENEDIKVIESVLQNIDDEIDAYVKTLDMEESKVDFLIEHTKRITVLENRDIIIELDLVAGAIIAGKDFLLYVHDTMPINPKRERIYPQSKHPWIGKYVCYRQCCDKQRRNR